MTYSTRSAIARTNQAYYAQLCETESLDWGIAYWANSFSELGAANQFREVIIGDSTLTTQVYREVEGFFTERKGKCLRWAPAVDFDGSALQAVLSTEGFHRVSFSAMRLDHWPKPEEPDPRIRILPARAMRAAFRSTYLGNDPVAVDSMKPFADAGLERLDHASLDMFVAMMNGQAVGRGGLFLVGDIGRVVDVMVLPTWRRQGVGRAILRHVIALAHRFGPKLVCAEVPASSPEAGALFHRMGFVDDGELVEFHRDHP